MECSEKMIPFPLAFSLFSIYRAHESRTLSRSLALAGYTIFTFVFAFETF